MVWLLGPILIMLIVNTFMFFYISIMVFLRQRLEAEKYNFDLDQYENRTGHENPILSLCN